MKHLCRAATAAALILLPAAVPSWAQSGAAAQRAAAQPRITGLEVNADAGLQPGSVLRFTLAGTPKGQARVRLAGSKKPVQLAETQPGTYTGSYTVRRDDQKLTPSSLIRSELTVAGRTRSVDYNFPASFGVRQAGGSAQSANAFRIDTFTSPLVDKALPGTELRFTVEGTPGGRASVQVPGLGDAIELREERPGRYAGTYVLRRNDVVKPGPAVATLRSGDKVATARLGHSLTRPAAASAGAAPAPAAPPPPLAIHLTHPQNGAVVDMGSGALQGQATPDADVQVVMHAIPPATGNQASVARTLLRTTVKADGGGRFSVPLQGVQRPEPGSQVQVVVAASRGTERTAEQRVTVQQR